MGGRLVHFRKNGRKSDNKWVLSIVRNGFRIPFIKIPPLPSVPIRMSQSSSPFLREEIENLLNKRAVERVQNPGTPGFYSRIFLVPKKNETLRLIIDLSLLNRYVEKQAFKMETVKSVRQAMRLNDWVVSIDLTDAYLHVSIHHQSRKYLRFVHEDQVYHFSALPFGMSLSVNFFETDGRYCSFSTPTCHISFSIPRRLADKKSDSQPTDYSDKLLHSNYPKPRFSAKSQEVRSLSWSEIHLHRYGISDATKFSQGSNGSCTEPNSNNQENNVSQTCIGTNFPFPFGQTQCCSRPCSPRQTALTSSSDVPAVCLETSYSSCRSPDLDKRYDSISLTMVDKPHSIRDRDFYPSSRPRILPLYGCQSLRMGSSFRADNTVLSWSLDRKPIPAPYQYVRNDGHTISTETSQNSYSPFLHHDIHRQHNGGLIYQQTGGTHSPNLCVEVWKILNWCLEQDIVIRVCHIPGKFNILADRLSRLDKPIKTEWALDQTVANSVFQMLNFPNVDLFATRFNHRLPLYVSPVQDYKALAIDALSMDWNHLHAYAFPPFILIPAVLEKIRQHQCRIVLIAPFWPQQQWFSELLLLLVSAPIRLPLIPRLLTQSKGRVVHQNLPILDLHAWELSNNQSEIRNFHKTLQILSPDQEEHLHKTSTMQNGPSFLIGVIQKRLIRSRPLLQL